VFDIDMQHGPNCARGELEIIAVILERRVIPKTLEHLGLDPAAPAAAHGPGVRGGPAPCRKNRDQRRMHLGTGIAAALQPGRRGTPRGHNAVDGRVINPGVES
jgi:hypothetical protein